MHQETGESRWTFPVRPREQSGGQGAESTVVRLEQQSLSNTCAFEAVGFIVSLIATGPCKELEGVHVRIIFSKSRR